MSLETLLGITDHAALTTTHKHVGLRRMEYESWFPPFIGNTKHPAASAISSAPSF